MTQEEIRQRLEELDNSLQSTEGESIPIPTEGNLGILALGYKGVMLWREKRQLQNQLQDLQAGKPSSQIDS